MRSSNELFQLATQRHQSGDLVGAQALYRELLSHQPDHADAYHLLGLALCETGPTDEAAGCVRQALVLQPANPAFHNNLGEIFRRQGDVAEAIISYRQALVIQPGFAEAHYNLGNALKASGLFEEAIASFRRAIELRPQYGKAHFNLANTLSEFGWVKDSIGHYRRALSINPDWSDAIINLGNAQAELGLTDEAADSYRRASELSPARHDLFASLAGIHNVQGRIACAREYYQKAAKHPPNAWLNQLRGDTLCEVIPPDDNYTRNYRDELLKTLARYMDQPRPIDLAQLHSSGAEPPMLLAYHGQDDLPIKRAYAELFQSCLPDTRAEAIGQKDKPHVGFVVTHGHEGVFFKCLGGIINGLSTRDLRVSIVCSRSGANILRQWVSNPGIDYLILPRRIDQAADCIRAAGVDLLHYWEVGTDSTNYFLPFFRPAPIQCATWGWPVTSGNSAIDYFVSSELLETPQSDRFYSEKLIRLPSLPTCYKTPPVSKGRRSRDQFGFGQPDHIYLCSQNLRKIQPDFDSVLVEILRADTTGQLILIADQHPPITRLLLDRIQSEGPDVANRIRMMPRMREADYLDLVALADVVLDTTHYGGGANTVFDAIAAGTLTVSLPGKYHRSRWCAAIYQKCGLDECIVASRAAYVKAAVHLGSDADYRLILKNQLTQTAFLFENNYAVSELEDFFQTVIAKFRD